MNASCQLEARRWIDSISKAKEELIAKMESSKQNAQVWSGLIYHLSPHRCKRLLYSASLLLLLVVL